MSGEIETGANAAPETNDIPVTDPIDVRALVEKIESEKPKVEAASSESELADEKAKDPIDAKPVEEKKAVEESTEKKEEDPRLSRRFAELTRREREIVKREQEFKDREKRFSDIEKRIKDAELDPLAAIEAIGLSYDKLTEAILSGHKTDPAVKKLEKELEAEREARLKEKEELTRKEQEKARTEFVAERTAKVKEAGEKFALVNALGEYDLVQQVTQEHWNETINKETGVGEVLSVDDAAGMVERWLESQVTKLKGISKLKTLLGILEEQKKPSKESAPDKDEAKASDDASNESSTLSNDMALDATEPSAVLSDEEALEKATRMLKFR